MLKTSRVKITLTLKSSVNDLVCVDLHVEETFLSGSVFGTSTWKNYSYYKNEFSFLRFYKRVNTLCWVCEGFACILFILTCFFCNLLLLAANSQFPLTLCTLPVLHWNISNYCYLCASMLHSSTNKFVLWFHFASVSAVKKVGIKHFEHAWQSVSWGQLRKEICVLIFQFCRRGTNMCTYFKGNVLLSFFLVMHVIVQFSIRLISSLLIQTSPFFSIN